DGENTRTQTGLRRFLDPLFQRLNGSEALAVAQKYTPSRFDFYHGRTYSNIVMLLIPHQIRLGTWPRYIEWETEYVGLSEKNPTVIPLPTIVEAYLNFGLAGIVIVMFLLGKFYKYVDIFLHSFSEYPLAIGLFAYMVWRIINIEHYLFIYLPATLKAILVVLIICYFYTTLRKVVGDLE
ncbi:MAG: hypothetical protein AAGU75_24015, partial [Bacillota bacterium]